MRPKNWPFFTSLLFGAADKNDGDVSGISPNGFASEN